MGSVGNTGGKGNGQDAGGRDKGRGRSTSVGVGMGVLGAEEGTTVGRQEERRVQRTDVFRLFTYKK